MIRTVPARVLKTLESVRQSGNVNMFFGSSVIYNTMYYDWWSYRWLKIYCGKKAQQYGEVLEQFSRWKKENGDG